MQTLIKLLGITLVISSATAMALDTATESATTSSLTNGVVANEADNTGLNSRDKSDHTLTPQKQSNSESDIETLAAVRRAIVDDESLSTSAHNVKILVVNGSVTLRGPVKNANEKARIEELTRRVAGVLNIDNQLDINIQ
jgi:hyperosmotically inducible protein